MNTQKKFLKVLSMLTIILLIATIFIPGNGNRNAIASIGILGILLLFLSTLLPKIHKLTLRTYIEDALYPYIALQDCLVVDMERIEDTPIIYNTITQKVYENGQWSKQDLDLHGKLLIYVKSSPPMPAATEQINNGF